MSYPFHDISRTDPLNLVSMTDWSMLTRREERVQDCKLELGWQII